MDVKQKEIVSRVLYLVAATILSVFLLIDSYYPWDTEKTIRCLIVVILVFMGIKYVGWLRIALACAYFAYAINEFVYKVCLIESPNIFILTLNVLPWILAGAILILSIKYGNNNVLLVICIIQIAVLFSGQGLIRIRSIIYILIQVSFLLSLDAPIILTMVDSLNVLLKRVKGSTQPE